MISVSAAGTGRVRVRVLLLERPTRGNAMVPEMLAALAETVRREAADPAVGALVLSGAGSAFCVGADLQWLGGEPDPAEAVGRLVAAHHDAVRALQAAAVPVLAAVNGPAAGGGMSLALATDYRVACMGATFIAAYFRLGLPPDGGTSAFLARSIGPARAMELLLTNRALSAVEAQAWGLVSHVVPAGALMDRAIAVAEHIAALGVPPETLCATRALLDSASHAPLEQQLDAEEQALRAAASQPAFKMALRQFLEHRAQRRHG